MNAIEYYSTLRAKAEGYLKPKEIDILDRAFGLALSAHSGQNRDSGEEYILHPLAVTDYLLDQRMDIATLAAAVLHDVPEDTAVSLGEIEVIFGNEIRRLVDGVTKLGQIKTPPGASEDMQAVLGQAETLDKMMLASSNDIRVILIKLADRLHNLRTILVLPEKRKRKVALSSQRIYIPLATRLGIWSVKTEMECLTFQALEPETYNELNHVLESREQSNQLYMTNISWVIQHRLIEKKIECEIYEVPVSAFDLYKHVIKRNIPLEQMDDSLTICLLVPEVDDCYIAQGAVHALWKPLPGRIDDYIASPIDNLYRSIHTTVIGPGGRTLKIRIRTHEMDDWARFGIYAFWRNRGTSLFQGKPEDRLNWLGRMSEWRSELSDPQEFVETLMSDILSEHIDIFTPKGDVIELPKGATPLDFAYSIHTNIGHACRKARINNLLLSLNHPLRNGDQVTIITIPDQEPLYEWLDPSLGFIKTSQAKRAIRRWFRRQSKDDQIERGKKITLREFKLLSIEKVDVEYLTRLMGFMSQESFLEAVGSAEIYISEVSEKYLNEKLGLSPKQEDINSNLSIQGAGALKVRLGKCCNPQPGSSIIGRVNNREELTVHRWDCQYALGSMDSGRVISLSWNETRLITRLVHLIVEAFDRSELLRDFTDIIAEEKINMTKVTAITRTKSRAIIEADLKVEYSKQLLGVLHKVDQLPNVIQLRCNWDFLGKEGV